MSRSLASPTISIAIFAVVEFCARGQCPAVGQDTTCGIVITITNTGASVLPTGQGPYDGADDTLIGVVNKSNQSIRSIGLMSPVTSNGGIFAFDGDGLTAFGVAGNSMDSGGYGGPNAYFTNISADATSGVVNFISPIAPNGTAFFALENALNGAIACPQIINNSVPKPPGGGTTISATFTPNRLLKNVFGEGSVLTRDH